MKAKLDLLKFFQSLVTAANETWALDVAWNKANRSFVLGLSLFAPNESQAEIVDAAGVSSDLSTIEFYDEILIYDPSRMPQVDEQNYLACIPYAGKAGWTLQYAHAFRQILQQTVTAGHDQLVAFLGDDAATVFNLTFDVAAIDQLAATLPANLAHEQLPYPRF